MQENCLVLSEANIHYDGLKMQAASVHIKKSAITGGVLSSWKGLPFVSEYFNQCPLLFQPSLKEEESGFLDNI